MLSIKFSDIHNDDNQHCGVRSKAMQTCDVENDKCCPMGGIDGCILLLNELLVTLIIITKKLMLCTGYA